MSLDFPGKRSGEGGTTKSCFVSRVLGPPHIRELQRHSVSLQHWWPVICNIWAGGALPQNSSFAGSLPQVSAVAVTEAMSSKRKLRMSLLRCPPASQLLNTAGRLQS